MNPIARRPLWMLLAAVALVLAIIAILLRTNPSDSRPTDPGIAADPVSQRKSQAPSRRDGTARIDPANAIADAASALRICQAPEDSARVLNQLAGLLQSADSETASAAILAFFASGDDVATGMPFVVGAESGLDSWPSLRLFLLETLPSIDPEAALELSRQVMDRTTSPDEYAIALRNLSWSDLDGDMATEFGERFERMLRVTEWRRQPGPAFLEAMDAALLLPPDRGAALLAEITSDPTTTPELSRAAFIALDRIAERDPAVLVSLETDRMGPDQRASLMSRLELADKEQRGRFTNYLSSLPEGSELDYFASLFPNGNHLQGNRLFSTPDKPPSIAERREKDRRVLAELSAMEFPPGTPAANAVNRITERLTKWLAERE